MKESESREEQPEEHPEEILHRARLGLPLSRRERLLKAQHLAGCDVCRLLEETRVELLDEAARPAGGKSISALVAATMASFQAPPAPVPAAPTGRRLRARPAARLAAFAAAVLCLLAGVALAARWIVEARTATRAHEELSSHVSAPSRPVALHPAGAPAALPAPPGEQGREAPAAPSPEPAAGSAPAPSDGAAALFARATEARRAGRVDEARRAYDRLWRDFPETVEARTGRVAYARWLLDRHEPRPAALAFGEYLRDNPRGTLAAEAGVGLAEALERLGDRPGARRAWEDVLANPDARPFARHARSRVRALDARAPDTTEGAPTP